jgi:hypothetical protein
MAWNFAFCSNAAGQLPAEAHVLVVEEDDFLPRPLVAVVAAEGLLDEGEVGAVEDERLVFLQQEDPLLLGLGFGADVALLDALMVARMPSPASSFLRNFDSIISWIFGMSFPFQVGSWCLRYNAPTPLSSARTINASRGVPAFSAASRLCTIARMRSHSSRHCSALQLS